MLPEGQATGLSIKNGSGSELGVVASLVHLEVAGRLGSWPPSLLRTGEQCVLSGVPSTAKCISVLRKQKASDTPGLEQTGTREVSSWTVLSQGREEEEGGGWAGPPC